MTGLLLINKPIGITSFDVIRDLRRRTGERKIGHVGTLDPLASGLMLVLLGTACKQAQSLTKLDKTYRADITLGATSTTGDAEGQLTSGSNRQPSLAEVQEALVRLTGSITQTPPIYSAIKIGGKEAYKYARAGRTVEMPSRQVTIYKAHILSYNYPHLEAEFEVSSGTYIRTLAEDLGKLLGAGAYLSGLVRTAVGSYQLSEALALDEIEAPAVAEQHLRSM